jgi:hypothetical protein
MSLLSIVRKTYPEAHRVFIFQRHERKFGWHTYHETLPELTVDNLAQLMLSGHTMVSLKIVDKTGWPLANCSDYAMKEFFPRKSLTVKNPTDNGYITIDIPERW